MPRSGTVRMVWAQSPDGVIGVDGALPWHLPEDLRLFRALTLGSTVVMGRRTWESLPARARPLPGRRNVVLSSALPDGEDGEDGATVARSVGEVLTADGDLWVIGGGGVYAAFLPHATEVVVTEVDARPAGDTWAPALGDGWTAAAGRPADGWAVSTGGLRFRVTLWRRAGAVPGRVADVLTAQSGTWPTGGRSSGDVGAGR